MTTSSVAALSSNRIMSSTCFEASRYTAETCFYPDSVGAGTTFAESLRGFGDGRNSEPTMIPGRLIQTQSPCGETLAFFCFYRTFCFLAVGVICA